jgi:hypothetical protein
LFLLRLIFLLCPYNVIMFVSLVITNSTWYTHSFSFPYTFQQNGKAECVIRIVNDIVCFLICALHMCVDRKKMEQREEEKGVYPTTCVSRVLLDLFYQKTILHYRFLRDLLLIALFFLREYSTLLIK